MFNEIMAALPKPPGKGAHLAVLVALSACFVCLMGSTLIQPLSSWPSEVPVMAPPTATATPVPPTVTPTASNTPAPPAPTFTARPPEPTRAPPTRTLTATQRPTATDTPRPPTPTDTPEPTDTPWPTDTPEPTDTPRPPTPTFTPRPTWTRPPPPTPAPTFQIIEVVPICVGHTAAVQLAAPPRVVVGQTATFTVTLQDSGCSSFDSLAYFLTVTPSGSTPVLSPVPPPPIVHNGTLTHNQSNTEIFSLTGATYGAATIRAFVTFMVQTAVTRYAATEYSNTTSVLVMWPID